MTQEIELIDDRPKTAVVATTPMQLLSMAAQNGASMEQLERFMAMQERWEANEARKAYTTAFAAFKAEAVKVIKNRSVDAGPLSGKKYAELFAVVNAVTEPLSRHGLSAAWKLTKDDKDWLEVTCVLKHSAGHSESVSMGGPPDAGGAKNAIQARASTVSYLERYTLKAILGISEQSDDDDGGRQESGDALIDAGREAAMEGMQALTAWWGSLDNRKRSAMSKEFTGMRRAAVQADKEAGRA